MVKSWQETRNREMQQRASAGFDWGTLLIIVDIWNHKARWVPCNFVLPDESKDLQVPSGLSMPSFMNCTEVFGLSSRLTPPTRAASHWPWRMAWKAFSKASKLEEQAVSMATLGPGEGEERRGKWIRTRNIIYRKQELILGVILNVEWFKLTTLHSLQYSSTNFSYGWTMCGVWNSLDEHKKKNAQQEITTVCIFKLVFNYCIEYRVKAYVGAGCVSIPLKSKK